jgi:hypothetical protein
MSAIIFFFVAVALGGGVILRFQRIDETNRRLERLERMVFPLD